METAGWHVRGAFESNEVLEWRWEAAFLYECMPTLMMDVDAGSMLADAKCITCANVGRRLVSLSLSESPSMLPSSRLFPLSSLYFEFIINCVSSASITTRYGSRRSIVGSYATPPPSTATASNACLSRCQSQRERASASRCQAIMPERHHHLRYHIIITTPAPWGG